MGCVNLYFVTFLTHESESDYIKKIYQLATQEKCNESFYMLYMIISKCNNLN